MTVLVIGATGFIGSHAARHLSGAGHEVAGTSRSGEGVDFACDLRMPETIEAMLESIRPDVVLMAAGMASVAEARDDPGTNFQMNTEGPFNLLDAIRRVTPDAHLILASSASVYGHPESPASLPFTEDDPVMPVSPYGAAKAATELLCSQYARQCGAAVTIARIFNQIGPGQSDAQAPAEFSREIVRAERRGDTELLLPVGDPTIERDFTDIRDTSRAWETIIDRRLTGVFNLCSGTGVSLERIIEGLATNSEIPVRVVPRDGTYWKSDIPLVFGSHELLTGASGWEPEISLSRSLTDLLADWRTRD